MEITDTKMTIGKLDVEGPCQSGSFLLLYIKSLHMAQKKTTVVI